MKGEEINRPLFAARYTFEAVEAVRKKLGAALDEYPSHDLVVAGGVAANSHLRRALGELAKSKGRELYIPPVSLCGDNAAMIGAQAYYNFAAGILADASLNASANDSITR